MLVASVAVDYDEHIALRTSEGNCHSFGYSHEKMDER